MASLISLPNELVLNIAECLPNLPDLAAFARTTSLHCAVLHRALCARSAASPRKTILFWAAAHNQIHSLRLALDAGADPNWIWRSRQDDALSESYRGYHDADYPKDYYSKDGVQNAAKDETKHAECKTKPPNSVYFWSAIDIAAYKGHDQILELLLARGGNPDWAPVCKFDVVAGPPLYLAITQHHLSTTELLLRNGASVHLQWAYPIFWDKHGSQECLAGITALAVACKFGSLPIAQLLLRQGYQTDIDVQDSRGRAAITYAFVHENWWCFDWLLFVGADINGGSAAESLLLYACKIGNFKDACRLVDLGADPNVRDLRQTNDPACIWYPPLHIVCCRPWSNMSNKMKFGLPLMRRLIEKGADLDAHEYPHWRADSKEAATPLGLAVLQNNVSAAEYLISKGARLNVPLKGHASILLAACDEVKLNLECISLLLKAGANLQELTSHDLAWFLRDVCSKPPDTPQKIEFIEALLDHCPKLEIDEQLGSAILGVFRVGDSAAAELLSWRWNPSIRLSIGDCFKALLRIPNVESLTTLMRLDQRNELCMDSSSVYQILEALETFSQQEPEPAVPRPEIVEPLIEKGARCDYTDESGRTALTYALAQKCTPDLVRKLLRQGADPNKGRSLDQTPLALAFRQTEEGSLFECLKVLLDAGARGIHQTFSGDGDSVFLYAIRRLPGSPQIIDLLLYHEPLQPDRLIYVNKVVDTAFQFGKRHVIKALLRHPWGNELRASIRKNANRYLHILLNYLSTVDGSFKEAKVADVLDVFACMTLLLGHGAGFWSQDMVGDGWDKLGVIAGRRDDPSARGLAYCFCQQFQWLYPSSPGSQRPSIIILSKNVYVDHLNPSYTLRTIGENYAELLPDVIGNYHITHLPSVHFSWHGC